MNIQQAKELYQKRKEIEFQKGDSILEAISAIYIAINEDSDSCYCFFWDEETLVEVDSYLIENGFTTHTSKEYDDNGDLEGWTIEVWGWAE